MVVNLGDPNQSIAMPELPNGYSTVTLTPRELIPWACEANDLSETFLKSAHRRGDRCVANFLDRDGQKQLVGYGFVTTSTAPLTDGVHVKIGPHLRYRYKGWTHPEHRRLYLSHARGRLNQSLFPMDQGQRMVSYIDFHNYPSRFNHAAVKPEEVGYCAIMRWFGSTHCFTSPGARKHGFELTTNRSADPNFVENENHLQ
ncbi:MAG: hypothetical protein AAF541_15455 [Pseudomonadota bacterium]